MLNRINGYAIIAAMVATAVLVVVHVVHVVRWFVS